MKRNVWVTITKDDRSTVEDVVSLGRGEILEGSAACIDDLAKIVYQPVGYCIYCFAGEDLRREHIIPFGLDGTAVLPAASCPKCAKITSAFEAQVLRGPFRSVRLLRKLRSRSKHRDTPTTGRLKVVRNEVPETIELPIDEFPVLLHFPVFGLPRFLVDKDHPGIDVVGLASVSFGPSPDVVLERLGAEKLVVESGRDRPVAFARMIAKIGYSMAVADGTLSRLDGPCLVLPAILQEPEAIGLWVGTLTDPIRKYPGLLHRIAVREDRQRGLLFAEVQLFADSEAPSYAVILGRLRM